MALNISLDTSLRYSSVLAAAFVCLVESSTTWTKPHDSYHLKPTSR